MSADLYVDFSWMTKLQVPPSCHLSLISRYGSGSALRRALQRNPYDPIDNIKRYQLRHAEAVSAALDCNNAGSPERAAAVLQHVLKAATSGSGESGLPWKKRIRLSKS
jgi:hypothetical protein